MESKASDIPMGGLEQGYDGTDSAGRPFILSGKISMEEDKSKIEAKVRREVMQLFIEEAKIEAEAKEQHDRLLKDKEEEERVRSAMGVGRTIKIAPDRESLELDMAAMRARMRLEERIRIEKLKGRRIFQAAVISSVVIVIAASFLILQQRDNIVYYDLGAIRDSLQQAVLYHGQFKVDEVILAKDMPYATLDLSFVPTTEKDLKDFVENVIRKYSMLRPGEKINLVLKAQKRVYATVSYLPRSNSIEIELMR